MWAGDQLLWELRAAGAEGSDLEATTGSGLTLGMVSYTHGGGIDRPLAMHKEGYRSLVPHETWRGQFTTGTCVANGGGDCGVVPWPGWRTSAYHAMVTPPETENWRGGLVDGMRDATGQMYMRNRYYDPQTGQFTQPDPIGLAGGLNSYGFANGDPVTYSDPYGLSACPNAPEGDPRRGPSLADCTRNEIQRLMGLARREPAHDMALAGGLVAGVRALLGSIGRRLGREAADAADDPTGPQSQYDDSITQANSVRNVQTDVTRADFENTLGANGWSRTGSKDGKVMIHTKDGAKYVVRDNARSTGGPTADYYGRGSREIDLKLRLRP